jgi:alpha-glucosidase
VLDLPDEALQDPMWERSGRTERGRDGCRVPLPWSSSGPALGFSSAEPWLPMPPSWRALSVEVQDKDPGSMLALYRAALTARRSISGDLRWLDAPDGVLMFARGDFVCAVNTGTAPVELPVDPSAVELWSQTPQSNRSLPGETAAWWRA